MMKNNKGLVITTIIFGILVVLMGSYIVCDNFIININNDNSVEVMEYTYENVKGLYEYVSETVKNEYGEHNAYYYLYLNENGTFNYKKGTGALCGHICNYIIKENTIVLNYLFSTDNGTGVYATTGTKTILITGKDNLLDVNPSVTVANMKNVPLKKASPAEESEYRQYGDVSHILKNYDIINNATNK